jgi:hypothetical protein
MAQFNATTNSLYADALFWSGATSVTFPVDPDFTRSANFALEFLGAIIMKYDSNWEWTDNNSTGELIDATTNLVSGTTKYAINIAWLRIARVRVKDSNGNWVTLDPVDRRQLSDANLASSGTPWGYYKLGAYIYLVGTPNYSSTAGLEIQMQKGADVFVVADTSKVPGIVSPFHRLISLMSALDWTEANEMETRAKMLRNRIGTVPDPQLNDGGSGMLREFCLFYSNRDRDGAPSMTLKSEDYGSGSMGDDYFGGIDGDNPRGF